MDLVLQNNLNSRGDDYLLQKKFEILIEMNNKKFQGELSTLKSTVERLTSELSEIKKVMLSGSRRQVERVEPQQFVEHQQAPQEFIEQPEVIITASAKACGFNSAPSHVSRGDAPKPRYGDYQPKDVSIDKIFYFGGRK
jgi:hypothetical protein